MGFYASRAIASVGPVCRDGRHSRVVGLLDGEGIRVQSKSLFGSSGQGTVELLAFAADFCFASFVIIFVLTLKR